MICPFASKMAPERFSGENNVYYKEVLFHCRSDCACYNPEMGRCGLIGRSDKEYQTLLEKIVHLQNNKLKEKE